MLIQIDRPNFSINNLSNFVKLSDYYPENCETIFNDKTDLIEYILYKKPKIIFLRDYSVITIKNLKFLKENINTKIVVSVGFPIKKDLYNFFDIVIFRNPNLYNNYNKYAKKSHLIYHSFNEKILEKIKVKKFSNKKTDFSFAGSVQSDNALNHYKRYMYIIKILKKHSLIKFYINEKISKKHMIRYYSYKFFKKKNFFLNFIYFVLTFFEKIQRLILNREYILSKITKDIFLIRNRTSPLYIGPIKKLFKNRVENALFGEEYYNLINDTKVSINIHTDLATSGFDGNIRSFEVTGLNSCLLVENGKYLKFYFDDDEVVTYSNFDEFAEKINFLKNNLDYAEQISRKAHIKTLNFHTHKIRSEELLDIFIKSV